MIKPLATKIVVSPEIEKEKKSSSGIILTTKESETTVLNGTVERVSELITTIKVGDRVLYNCTDVIKHEEKHIIDEFDVIGICE